MCALLFSIPYALLYLFIIHFEEKNLLERYGEEYKEYKRKTPWKMIPKVIWNKTTRMKNLLLIIVLIFGGQTLGCLVGLIKNPKDSTLYGSLSFAASMMLGISFFQLIPESLKIIPFYLVIVSFFLGIIIMRIVDHLLPHINPELLKKEKLVS